MQKIKPFKIFKTLLNHALIAKESGYPYKHKLEILKILNSLYLKSIFFGKKQEVTQKIFGYKVTAYDYSNILYLFKEVFLSKEYYFRSEKSNPAIIDCGANIGMAVLYFKFLYPDSIIWAFEPNPLAFQLLSKNVTQNNLTNVELRNVALSNRDGSIEFFTKGKQGMLVASIIKERGGDECISIPSQKMSDFIKNDKFDLLKMDIEGAETEVLEDLVSAGKITNISSYIIEYHHRISHNKTSLAGFIIPFENLGYGYNVKTSFHKLGSFQDILLYFFKKE
jgi:FkbM family methyltransferase